MESDTACNINPSNTASDAYSYICQVNMDRDSAGDNNPSDTARDGIKIPLPLHRRMSHPMTILRARQWSAEEDEMLRMAVQRLEVKSWKKLGRETNPGIPVKRTKGINWKKIAECFKDRTPSQCAHRWRKVLDPDLAKGPFSNEEDELIIELVNKYGQERWSTIAAHLPGRTGNQCRQRWLSHLNPNINKEARTQDEELALNRAHPIYGNNWTELTKLTKFLLGRKMSSLINLSPLQTCTFHISQVDVVKKFVKEMIRWKRNTSGLMVLKPIPWAAEEDELLRMAVERYTVVVPGGCREPDSALYFTEGKNWTMIDRSDRDCAMRWRSLLTMDIAKSPWSKEDDDRMIQKVKHNGEESWSTITLFFPGRSEEQCRERWHNQLKPNIDIEAWTQEEELAWIRIHQNRGNNWAGLSNYFPGRTEDEIKNHWYSCVENKLGMYPASGLVPQFHGLSLASRPNPSAASSSSMVFIENHFHL